ncbi:hypothetical protein NQ117_13605 [Paenibacillus sp. SC116]|uniref:hypothetical protein n=1 Tax=Paenibacillus sp. SC116 TaxID=2968986 RepID=UPI00215AC443|nr:hypothetical protein [Paenibacillus sp. SC116]MCR8844721.1 hypothetical protein [Paenibacillus sp. SC116]
MKAWNKLLLTTTAVTLLALPLSASALSSVNATGPVPTAKVIENKKDQAEQAATKGLLEEIKHTKTGSQVLVKGEGVRPVDQDTIILNINSSVPVVDQHGKPADLVEALQQEWTVTAYYNPAITKSLPAKGNAEKFVVERPEVKAMVSTGIVDSTGKDRVVMVGDSKIVLNLSEDTVITDKNGKVLKQSDLKAGQRIEAHYGPMMTASLPPISPAQKIVVLGETSRVEGVVAKDMSKDAKSIHIDTAGDKKMENDMILHINEDTSIINIVGTPVKPEEIKKGTKVAAYHSLATTFSIPAQSSAYVIVVLPEPVK